MPEELTDGSEDIQAVDEPVAEAKASEPQEPEEIYPQFLEELDAPVAPPPQYHDYQPTQRYYQEPPRQQQYAQPPQQAKVDITRFVDDPEGAIASVVEQRLQERMAQYVGPLAYQNQVVQAQIQSQMRAAAGQAYGQAEDSIRSMYKSTFNKDDAFRGHKGVKAKIENFMKETLTEAKRRAEVGDQWGFQTLARFSEPKFAEAALAIAKIEAGYGGKQQPVKMTGYKSESARPNREDTSGELDPTTEDLLMRRFGADYVERYRKAMSKKNNDIEFF